VGVVALIATERDVAEAFFDQITTAACRSTRAGPGRGGSSPGVQRLKPTSQGHILRDRRLAGAGSDQIWCNLRVARYPPKENRIRLPVVRARLLWLVELLRASERASPRRVRASLRAVLRPEVPQPAVRLIAMAARSRATRNRRIQMDYRRTRRFALEGPLAGGRGTRMGFKPRHSRVPSTCFFARHRGASRPVAGAMRRTCFSSAGVECWAPAIPL